MNIKSAELDQVCGVTSKLPEHDLFEVAFAGKSNVGKSSLINGLLNRKALARTSQQPGKTQTINFYKVCYKTKDIMLTNGEVSGDGVMSTNDETPDDSVMLTDSRIMSTASKVEDKKDLPEIEREIFFTDLPGYGYAKVSAKEREKWGKMIENYLHTSEVLLIVFLLVDIRHEPSANDKMMYDWILDNGYRPVVIATKSDKIKRSQLQKQFKIIRNGLNMKKEDVLLSFSALNKSGRKEVWEYIDSIVATASTPH